MRRTILFVFLSVFITSNATAQVNHAVADSILARVEVFQKEIKDLTQLLPAMTGEDSLIIDHELQYAQLQALDQVYLLIDYLVEHKDTSPIRLVEQSMIDLVPANLIRAEADVEKDLKILRSQRSLTPTSKLGLYEEMVAESMERATAIQSIIFEYLHALEKLDQPNIELKKHLQTEVKDRVRVLIGRLRIALKEQSYIERRTPSPATGEDAILLKAATLRVEATVTNIRHLISLMKKMDLDSTTHEAFLIQSTGQLTTADLASGALVRYLNNWLQGLIHYLHDNGLDIVLKILMVIGLLVLFHYLGKLVSKLIIASIDASRFRPSKLLRNMIENMSSKIVMLTGVLIALSQLGISLGPMLAGLGVVGFIVGFALQDTLANFASGIMILFYRPFDVGDMVETGAVFGKVRHMSLVSTTILTIDNQTLVVPNNMIWGNVIKNVTAQNLRRVDMIFGVSYSDDIPKVEGILMDIIVAHDKVLKKPAPVVKLHELGDSSVNFVVRPWVRTEDYWEVHWDVTREVKMQFDAEGISIPFPQQDVHLFEDKGES